MKYKTFRNLLRAGVLATFLGGAGYCIHLARRPAPTTEGQASTLRPLTTAEIRVVLDDFLTANPDHGSRKSWSNCIPNMPFRAEAVRFPDADHERWSSADSTKWSQIRLTHFSDGRPDEKWLLKNGHTYKREVLDRDGNVTETEHF